jgi:hypothetical protein
MGLIDRFKRSWNAFASNRDPTVIYQHHMDLGAGYSSRPDRPRLTRGNERSIVTAIFNRIAMDVAAIDIRHVKLDEDGRYKETMKSSLNDCFELAANVDQTGRAFIQDVVMSMFDEGHVVMVPVDTDVDPNNTSSFDVLSMRTGKVVEWFPRDVRIRVYNDRIGRREDIILPKHAVAIIENPLYAIMNEPNSTMQRLIRKLNLLDAIDEQSGSGKLDLIIQLPYVIKTPQRKQQAEDRRKDIEMQLSNSKYGIAYTDGTERITQLNRPVENNLMKQIEYLTEMLYSQLSINKEVMDGSADEKKMLNYNTRTVEPIVAAIVDGSRRAFLSKTARTQGQSIMYFRDPLKLVPANEMADIADKFTRNEIMTSNEIRQKIGMKPSNDPKADQLVNSNISQPNDKVANQKPTSETPKQNSEEGGENQNG